MSCEDSDTDNSYNYIGLIGSLILTLSIIPQVYKTYISKSADDLSYKWLYSTIIGLILVNIYAVNFNLWSLYIPGFMELMMVIVLFGLKHYYS
tara:strand:+ start:195 stop:473 length:279 start_codon:yes stop_codon:yes gene_type:complete